MAQLTPALAGPSGTGEEKFRTDLLEQIRDGLKIILADIQARLSEETDGEMRGIEIEQQLAEYDPPSPFDRILHELKLIREALQAPTYETDIRKLRIDMASVLQYLEDVKKSPPPDSNQLPLGWIRDHKQGILQVVEADAGELTNLRSLLRPPSGQDGQKHPLHWIEDRLLDILKEVQGPPPSPGTAVAAFRNYSQEIEEVPLGTTLRTAFQQHVSRLETQLEVNRGQGRLWHRLRRRRRDDDMEQVLEPQQQQHPLEWIRRGLDLILEEGRRSPWNCSELTFSIIGNILTAIILGFFWMLYFRVRHQTDGCPSPCAPCPPCPPRNWSSIILKNVLDV